MLNVGNAVGMLMCQNRYADGDVLLELIFMR